MISKESVWVGSGYGVENSEYGAGLYVIYGEKDGYIYLYIKHILGVFSMNIQMPDKITETYGSGQFLDISGTCSDWQDPK